MWKNWKGLAKLANFLYKIAFDQTLFLICLCGDGFITYHDWMVYQGMQCIWTLLQSQIVYLQLEKWKLGKDRKMFKKTLCRGRTSSMKDKMVLLCVFSFFFPTRNVLLHVTNAAHVELALKVSGCTWVGSSDSSATGALNNKKGKMLNTICWNGAFQSVLSSEGTRCYFAPGSIWNFTGFSWHRIFSVS